MGASIYAVDDREGGPVQLVVKAARKQPADNRIAARLRVEHEFKFAYDHYVAQNASPPTFDD